MKAIKKKKLGLTAVIFIALLLGALVGLMLHYWVPESYICNTVIINITGDAICTTIVAHQDQLVDHTVFNTPDEELEVLV